MKLEPVYLLAPEPQKKPVLPTRRAILGAGVASVAMGFGAGFALGRRRIDDGRSPEVGQTLRSGSVEWALDFLDAPDTSLMAQADALLLVAATSLDPRMEPVLQRLAALSTDHAALRAKLLELRTLFPSLDGSLRESSGR